MQITDPHDLLAEITDVLARLTKSESILVRQLQGLRVDVEARRPPDARDFTPRVAPDAPDPRPDEDASNGTAPTVQVSVGSPVEPAVESPVEPAVEQVEPPPPPPIQRADAVAERPGRPLAKRDYDFFGELDAKLARLHIGKGKGKDKKANNDNGNGSANSNGT
jgi:hypothetical protein